MVDSMNVRLYPNTATDDVLISEARDGIESALQQTKAYFSSNGEDISYTIFSNKDYPSVSQEPTLVETAKGATLRRFKTWLIENVKAQNAAHLLLTSGLSGGLAGGELGGPWRNDPAAIVSAHGKGNSNYFRSLAVHETYHLFLNTGSQLSIGDGYSEHILGEVIPSGDPSDPNQTPMVNGYLDDGLAAEGECNNTATEASFTTELSDCTLSETLHSYRNQGNII